MKICKQCGYTFTQVSSRFYCCDKQEQVCITCRRDLCKKCHKPRTNQLVPPKCEKCNSRLYQNDLLFEYNCQRYFCSRCLSSVFKEAYQKVSVKHLFDEKNQQILVRMHCGHGYPYNDLLGYFQHFCLECGRQYDLLLDYELNDGAKLCYFCFKYFEQKYRPVFIKCVGCDLILQNSSKAEIVDNQGMILCSLCVSESKIEEKSIQQSRAIPQNKASKQQFIQKNQDIAKKEQIKGSEKQLAQIKMPFQNQSLPKKGTSSLNKFLKKPSINQLKQKQAKRISHKNNQSGQSFSITSKFSNEMEEVDEQLTKQLGLSHNIKMKKHLSNKTKVQQFKIQICDNRPQQFVKCEVCTSLVSKKIVFDLSKQYLNGQKSVLVSFSTLQSSISQNKENSHMICRTCYFKSEQRDKSIIQINKSFQSAKRLKSSRRVKIEEPQMSYLKVNNKSFSRGSHSPSVSPSKQYSLTGQKNAKIDKQILKSPNQSKIKVQQKAEKPQQDKTKPKSYKNLEQSSHHKVHSSTSVNQQKKCGMCLKPKKSLVLTIKQGYLCDDCYYKKSPHKGY